jgi:homoserine O-acetyltransferase
MSKARLSFTIAGEFPMYRGGSLRDPQIAYETWGTLNSDASNAVLIFTGLSPSAHAASSRDDPSPGWWEEIIGPGKPIDTRRYFVICVNSMGSCFGSTGPASANPETGELYRLNFPVLSLEDVARGGYETLRHLGIERVYTTVGPSMGGMTTLAFEMLYPGVSDSIVLMSSGTRSLPFSIALRSQGSRLG